MKFNSELFRSKNKCFRSSWQKGHYLTYDGENFIEHFLAHNKIWYWETTEEIEHAIADLSADDWQYE